MNDKLDLWLIQNGKHLPQDSIFGLQEKLTKLPEQTIRLLFGLDLKNPVVMLLLCIFLSFFAVDRFMIGHIGMGILRIGIWLGWFILIIAQAINLSIAATASGHIARDAARTAEGLAIAIGVLAIPLLIYAIIEMVSCMKRTREYNLQLVMKTIGVTR